MSASPSPHNSPDDRLITLEEKLAFQQHLLDEINAVVVGQQAEIDRLRRDVSQLTEASRVLFDRSGDNLPHEKPPHY
jgi:SlyX protein